MTSPQADERPLGSPPRRVLVVDDNPQGRAALARLLEIRGFTVETASCGADALEILSAAEPPRFIITDLVLPDLDGREVARAAKKLQPKPWVVLITGWGFEATPAELSRDGIDLLMPKPLDVRSLCDRLESMVGSQEEGT